MSYDDGKTKPVKQFGFKKVYSPKIWKSMSPVQQQKHNAEVKNIKDQNRKRRRPKRTYTSYIYKALKEQHPQLGISKKAMAIMDSIVVTTYQKLMNEIPKLLKVANRRTVSEREVESAVRQVYPGELKKYAIAAGTTAVTKFKSATSGNKKNPVSKSKKADIAFPVARIRGFMRYDMRRTHFASAADVYMAAVLEYIIKEVIQYAGQAALDLNRLRIIPRSIMLAIKGDKELRKLMTGTVAGAGVYVHLNKKLLQKYTDEYKDVVKNEADKIMKAKLDYKLILHKKKIDKSRRKRDEELDVAKQLLNL